jgi:hypothetical protein
MQTNTLCNNVSLALIAENDHNNLPGTYLEGGLLIRHRFSGKTR